MWLGYLPWFCCRRLYFWGLVFDHVVAIVVVVFARISMLVFGMLCMMLLPV